MLHPWCLDYIDPPVQILSASFTSLSYIYALYDPGCFDLKIISFHDYYLNVSLSSPLYLFCTCAFMSDRVNLDNLIIAMVITTISNMALSLTTALSLCLAMLTSKKGYHLAQATHQFSFVMCRAFRPQEMLHSCFHLWLLLHTCGCGMEWVG